jgi:hypothetical protein
VITAVTPDTENAPMVNVITNIMIIEGTGTSIMATGGLGMTGIGTEESNPGCMKMEDTTGREGT